MKNKEITKTFTIISTDHDGQECKATAPRGYVQASDYAKSLLVAGHTDVKIIISYLLR